MTARVRLLTSAVLAAIAFGIGFFDLVFIPGAGDTTANDFTRFYDSDARKTFALVLLIVAAIGSLLMIWFLEELRTRLPDDVLARVGRGAAWIGIILVPVAAGIMGAPAAQGNDIEFAGVPVANAFSQAGLGIALVVGMPALGIAAVLLTLAMRRAGVLPNAVAWGGIILGIITLASFFWIPGYAYLLWVLMVGIVVSMRERDGAGAPAER